MAAQTPTTDTPSNPMPTWLSIPIILLCLLGGGWIIHYYVISDPLSRDVKVLSNPVKTVSNPVRNNFNGNNNNGNGFANWLTGGGKKPAKPAGINGSNTIPHVIALDDQKTRWEVKTETAQLIAFNQNGAFNIRVLYNNPRSILPGDVRETLAATNQMLRDKHTDALKLTNDQTRRLRALSNANEMTLTPADKKSLEDEMAKYIHASEPDRQGMTAPLYQSLDQIAKSSIPATIQTATEHAAEINKIMTPELWQQNAALSTPVK